MPCSRIQGKTTVNKERRQPIKISTYFISSLDYIFRTGDVLPFLFCLFKHMNKICCCGIAGFHFYFLHIR